MDPSLKLWRTEGETFIQRLFHWSDILNPILTFAQKKDINNARSLLLDAETDSLLHKEMETAWKLSVASVNPSNGEIIPVLFRPPALFPFGFPSVVITTLQSQKRYGTVLSQALFHMYATVFGLVNGNHSGKSKQERKEEMKKTRSLDIWTTTLGIAYATFMGSAPHIYLNHYKPRSPSVRFIVKTLLPGPLTASLCAMNVVLVRCREYEDGIQVMDSKGNVVGTSKKAGEEAVKDTALSRAVLFGTSVFVPDLIMHNLKRIFVEGSSSFNMVKSAVVILVFQIMIPVTFSWMPQLGKINRNELEPEIVSSTEESELFYYRGI